VSFFRIGIRASQRSTAWPARRTARACCASCVTGSATTSCRRRCPVLVIC